MTIPMGFNRSSNYTYKKKILIYSIVRNIEHSFDQYYKQINEIAQSFSEYIFYLSIYENDSMDNTKKLLFSSDWSLFDKVSIISEKLRTVMFSSVKDVERVSALANSRNKALRAGDFVNDVDYVLMIDADMAYDIESIKSLLSFKELEPKFDIVSSVSIDEDGGHYDWWATRIGPEYNPKESDLEIDYKTKKYGSYYSTSNGLCLYNAIPFKKGAEYGYINKVTGSPDCEMVVVCQNFRELGHDKIFILYDAISVHQ